MIKTSYEEKGGFLQSLRYTNTNTIFLFLFLIAIYAVGSQFRLGTLLMTFSIIWSVILVLKSKNNIPLFVITLFMTLCNYSIYVFHWLDLVEYLPIYGYKYLNSDNEVMMISAQISYIFMSTLLCLFPKVVQNTQNFPLVQHTPKNRNTTLPYVVSIFAITLVSGYFIYQSLTRGYREMPIFEYMIVFYILAFYYANSSIKLEIPIYLLLLVNCVFVFASGDRGAAMQYLLVAYFCKFQHRTKKSVLLIILIVGIIFLNGIGFWRGNFEFSMSIFSDATKALMEKKLALNTAYAADAAGHCIVKLAGDYSIEERLILFFQYLISVLIGGNLFGDNVNLSRLSHIKYPYHGGGGLLGYYGYFYLGYFGVILFGMIVAHYINIVANIGLSTKNDNLERCIVVYFASTFTRWFLYSPAPLFRGMLFLVLCTWGLSKLEIKTNSH